MDADLLHPTRWTDYLEIVLVACGAATILVTTLQQTVDPLREWSLATRSRTDDRLVAIFATVVNTLAAVLQAVGRLLAVVAVRPQDARRRGVERVAVTVRPASELGESSLEDTDVREIDAFLDQSDIPTPNRPKPKTYFKAPPTSGAGVLLLLLLVGCSHGQLKRHAIAAELMSTSLATAAKVIESEARSAEQRAVDRTATRDEARFAVDMVRARFQSVERLYAAAREAHAGYVAAIVRANAEGRGLDPRAPGELLQAWTDLVNVAAALGFELPKSPVALEKAAAERPRLREAQPVPP